MMSAKLKHKLKRTGQAFTAVILLSILQGLVALYNYRHDVRGKLAYPDGLTRGKEEYTGDAEDYESEIIVDTKTSVMDDEERADDTSFLDSLLPYIVNSDNETPTKGSDEKVKCVPHAPNIPSLLRKLISNDDHNDPIRVLVIGDSLAIGVGCIEKFDITKVHSVAAPALVENTSAELLCDDDDDDLCHHHHHQGPVFPQTLARTLSRHFRLPVQWRSAGVDGGDVYEIRSHCLDVIKQECNTHGVDIVVVLFGFNDLKRLLPMNPTQSLFDNLQIIGRLRIFRQGIEMLLTDIRIHAPGAVVVFPGIPFQTTVLPLGLMMDCLVGLWERLKKMVVRGRSDAIYLDMDSKDISHLYSYSSKNYGTSGNALMDENGSRLNIDDEECDDSTDVLSPDGVHPNKKLYQKWAELVGRKLYVRIQQQKNIMDQRKEALVKD
jgi:lysophospholipase L1-like esterase